MKTNMEHWQKSIIEQGRTRAFPLMSNTGAGLRGFRVMVKDNIDQVDTILRIRQ
jgi:hypothetical protein